MRERNGGRIGRRKIIAQTAAFVLPALIAVCPRPGLAQVAFGSPADPPSIAIGAGAFNINPNDKHRFSQTSAQLQGEYRFGDVLWIIAPFIGLMGTSSGGFYGYGGFGF